MIKKEYFITGTVLVIKIKIAQKNYFSLLWNELEDLKAVSPADMSELRTRSNRILDCSSAVRPSIASYNNNVIIDMIRKRGFYVHTTVPKRKKVAVKSEL